MGGPAKAGGEIVTLLFTDLVGSTELFDRLGDDAAENVRRRHFHLLREAVAERGGHEVKNLGDGLMVVFGSAVDAVASAMEIQRAVARHNRRSAGPPFHVRVGVHAGEPIREGDDYFGMSVIVAKRLCDRADGGQILASGVVAALVGGRGDFRFGPLGPLALKGVSEPVAACEVLWAGAGADALPRFRVLGPIEATDDGGSVVPLLSGHQRLLLAVLLASAGQVVSTDRLVECLWPDEPPTDPKGALQSQVWRLRRRLGGEAPLETTPTGYCLRAGADLDAERFGGLVARARLLIDDPAAALACWEESLALWRGPAFADMADHPDLAPRAAALDGLRAEAGEARVHALLALGHHPEALAAAEALAAEHPYRERPVELGMRALAALGRSVEAVRAYESFRRRLGDEVGLDPSPELRDLEAAIVRHERPGGAAPSSVVAPARIGKVVRPPTLAAPADAFIGRVDEIGRVSALLGPARLVTLVGPGGVGKTRLSLQVVDLVASRYPDGVWCCDLVSAAADDRVPDVVASTLRVDPRSGVTMTERVVEALAAKGALLLFDNCEHVIEGAAALAQAVLDGDTGVDVLATSREPLGVPGEQRVPLEPLPVPAADRPDPHAAAVELFTRRATTVDPAFRLDDETLPEVCELCRRVDGLPLAVELAAARVGARSVGEITAEVGERLAELAGGGRGRVARHRSTQAVVEWSYDLLAAPMRGFFLQLAVFAGGFDAAAAHAVCGGTTPGRVVDQLVRLVEVSLVVARRHGPTTRYSLLEPIRAYAEDRLRSEGGYDDTRARHARVFVDLAEQAHTVGRARDGAWAVPIEVNLANLRAAQEWLHATGDGDGALRLAASLYFYGLEGGAAEVLGWAERSVDRFGANAPDHKAGAGEPSTHLAAACGTAAVGAWRRGDLGRARRFAEQGVLASAGDPVLGRLAFQALADTENFCGNFLQSAECSRRAAEGSRTAGDIYQLVLDTVNIALALAYGGRHDDARGPADEALAVAQASRLPGALAWAYYANGEIRCDGDPQEAATLLERSLTEAERIPAAGSFVWGVAALSSVSLQARGPDPGAALARYPGLIEHWSRAGAWNQQWATIRTLVEALARTGHREPAAVLIGALTASPTATPLVGADAARIEGVVATLRAALGDAPVTALQARGAALGDASAVAFALDTLRTRPDQE